MTIVRAGTFPVSALNLGLAGVPPGIAAGNAKLAADASKLTGALSTQLAVTVTFPPNVAGYTTAFAAALDPSAVASAFLPANWATLNADGNVTLAADLALVETQIAIVEPLETSLILGLGASSLVGWSYAGRAATWGPALTAATASGYGGIAPNQTVSALIIGTSAFASWQAFSEGFETGPSSDQDIGNRPAASRLTYLGRLSGSDWNTGASASLAQIRLILSGLRGSRSAIEAQAALGIGIGLPSPTVIVDAGLSVDLAAAFENLVNVQTDLDAGVSGINAQIDANLDLIAAINAQLSAGGLTLWSYAGPAGSLGATFTPEVAGGLPGVDDPAGPVYGIVIACASADDWSAFGNIFKTA